MVVYCRAAIGVCSFIVHSLVARATEIPTMQGAVCQNYEQPFYDSMSNTMLKIYGGKQRFADSDDKHCGTNMSMCGNSDLCCEYGNICYTHLRDNSSLCDDENSTLTKDYSRVNFSATPDPQTSCCKPKMCRDFACSFGLQKNASALDTYPVWPWHDRRRSVSTFQWCCITEGTCYGHQTCPSGRMIDSTKYALSVSNSSDTELINSTCCKDIPKNCSEYTCGTNYQLKSNADSIACTYSWSCSDGSCCDDEVHQCSSSAIVCDADEEVKTTNASLTCTGDASSRRRSSGTYCPNLCCPKKEARCDSSSVTCRIGYEKNASLSTEICEGDLTQCNSKCCQIIPDSCLDWLNKEYADPNSAKRCLALPPNNGSTYYLMDKLALPAGSDPVAFCCTTSAKCGDVAAVIDGTIKQHAGLACFVVLILAIGLA